MRRRLLNIAAALSVALCVAAAAMWALGLRRDPGIRGAYVSGTHFYAQVATNRLILSCNIAAGRDWRTFRAATFRKLPDGVGLVRRGGPRSNMSALPLLPPGDPAFSGVSLDDERIWLQPTPAVHVHVLTVAADHWVILLATAALAFAFRKAATASRKPGVCLECGYDLRATPDRCPECGAAPDLGSANGAIR